MVVRSLVPGDESLKNNLYAGFFSITLQTAGNRYPVLFRAGKGLSGMEKERAPLSHDYWYIIDNPKLYLVSRATRYRNRVLISTIGIASMI